MPTTKRTVLVTGFGPFGVHKVNASWVVVQHFAKLGLGDDVRLVVREIPVAYESVRTVIPSLWSEFDPVLVIHVGVSGVANDLTLEQLAHNNGYVLDDITGNCPEGNCCVVGAERVISSEIDMQDVCDSVNNTNKITAVTSDDAGRYLCDFSYYTSLYINRRRCAFIHVPTLDKRYTAEELAYGLKVAILSMLEQISS
ncbi:pcp [Acanthosepion pharaonis]|uniref:Pcp n=1 Tax=Acanthosepion pharaonis TaxID=158019 RepID=A0A812C1C1_ACAPH|nr:pcp [Sepia pharaonis]